MKINIKDSEKICNACADVQARCRERLLGAWKIQGCAEMAELRLSRVLTKKQRIGARLSIGWHKYSDFPNSYKYRPAATVALIERFSSGWYMTAVYRADDCRSNSPDLWLTEEQTKIVKENLFNEFIEKDVYVK